MAESSPKPIEVTNTSSKPKEGTDSAPKKMTDNSDEEILKPREMKFLKVYLPQKSYSDLYIFKDLMKKSAFVKINKFGRSILVGFDTKAAYLNTIGELLEKNYHGKNLLMKSFPSNYTPLRKRLVLPREFTDKEAIKSHFGATGLKSTKVSLGIEAAPFMRHVLSFPSYGAVNKAVSKGFILNGKSYFLKPNYEDKPEVVEYFKKKMANKRNFIKAITQKRVHKKGARRFGLQKSSLKNQMKKGQKKPMVKKVEKKPVKVVKKREVKEDVKKQEVKKDVKKQEVKKDVKKQEVKK